MSDMPAKEVSKKETTEEKTDRSPLHIWLKDENGNYVCIEKRMKDEDGNIVSKQLDENGNYKYAGVVVTKEEHERHKRRLEKEYGP